MSTEPAPVFPSAWTDVLDRVAQALALTEAEAARVEQALTTAAPAHGPVPDQGSVAQDALARIGERLGQLDNCVAQAGEAAEQIEAALQGSETLLRRWLAEAEAVRGRLVNQATSSVS